MGGDAGPAPVVAGMAQSASKNPHIRFLVFGDSAQLEKLISKRRELSQRCDVRHADGVVTMDAKPSHAMRNGKGTSMWESIEAVRSGEAQVCVSCGNTGALMAMSVVRLRKIPGVNRPAIACLWPSRNPGGFTVMLDAGADIRADAEDLLQYALMGTSYARVGLGLDRPRVGLLNVGTEEHKGRAELKQAHDLISQASLKAPFEFIGYVEGGDLPSDRVDVVVTDGFPVGIVTERDLVHRVIAVDKKPDSCVADEVCTKPVIAVSIHADVDMAVDLMNEYGIRRVVVVDNDDKVVGILTTDDIAKNLRSMTEELAVKYMILSRRKR